MEAFYSINVGDCDALSFNRLNAMSLNVSCSVHSSDQWEMYCYSPHYNKAYLCKPEVAFPNTEC